MSDRMTPEQRHKCMSMIRGKDTKPELLVRRYLHAHGYRYRLHERRLPGRPDIVMKRLRTVILVNGCFWHGHLQENGEPCRYYVLPKTRTDFWLNKITTNQQRDLKVREELKQMGWNVIQIWECQLKPDARLLTLQSLVLTLSEIELGLSGKHRIKPYTMEEEAGCMVADEGEENQKDLK